MYILRDIAAGDLDGLERVAIHLDSVNLPDDRDALAQVIDRSRRSWSGELPVAERCFVFVAVDADSNEVAGTSMIFAQHGSRRAPHVFFDVLEEERYSETLDRHFVHQVLRIGYNYKGLTEVGGLVVRPELRRHPDRLGRSLFSARFVFIAMHRQLFRDEVLSELMPPLESDGTSLLWESLGRKFTGLSYQEADRMSQANKEFIRTLFPQDPLYVTLLPSHVKALIGQVGPDTKAVEKLLHEAGFTYAHRIDPFDGGPHFHARTDDISLVRDTHAMRVGGAAGGATSGGAWFLIAREREAPPCFLAARVRMAEPDAANPIAALSSEVRRVLDVTDGDPVAVLRLG
jgi:arginine N-succinyltransferase